MTAERTGVGTLLKPASMAVVGASADTAKISGKIIPAIARGGYTGRLYAVNPRRSSVGDVPSFPSLADIDDDVDVALIAVPQGAVLSSLQACEEKDVKAVVLYTGGFGETDEDGRAKESLLHDFAARTGIRILGPNCQGFLVPADGVCTTFNGVLARDENRVAGGVAWIGQSGAVGGMAVSVLRRHGLGVSMWASTGNESDLDFCDFVEHALDDERTGVICGYVERIKDIDRFRTLAARALDSAKPILLIKGGSSASGAAAALSHTGSLVGDGRVYTGMFAQYGVVVVEDLDQLAATAAMFHFGGQLRSRRVGILGNSGGTGVILADLCEAVGLTVPAPSESARERLAGMLPDFIRPSNPIDIPMQIRYRPSVLDECMQVLSDDGTASPGAYLVCVHSIFEVDGYDVAGVVTSLRHARTQTGAPVVLVPYGCDRKLSDEAIAGGIPVIDNGRLAVAALSQLAQWSDDRQAAAGEAPRVRAPRASQQIGATGGTGGHVSEHETKALLRQFGVPVPEGVMMLSEVDAAVAAGVGDTLVAKLASPSVMHKTDVGAVKLNLSGPDELAAAWRELRDVAAGLSENGPVAVLVEEMAPPGTDLVVAARRDPHFGLVVMLGLGGTFVETIDDVAVRLAPVSGRDVERMVDELKLGAVLRSSRGREAAPDLGWLADLLDRLGRLMEHHELLAEVELNPVRVFADGRGGMVLDALATGSAERPAK